MTFLCAVCLTTLENIEKPLPENYVPEWFGPAWRREFPFVPAVDLLDCSYHHHRDAGSLKRSANSKCYICTRLVKRLLVQDGNLDDNDVLLDYHCYVAWPRVEDRKPLDQCRVFHLIFIGDDREGAAVSVAFNLVQGDFTSSTVTQVI